MMMQAASSYGYNGHTTESPAASTTVGNQPPPPPSGTLSSAGLGGSWENTNNHNSSSGHSNSHGGGAMHSTTQQQPLAQRPLSHNPDWLSSSSSLMAHPHSSRGQIDGGVPGPSPSNPQQQQQQQHQRSNRVPLGPSSSSSSLPSFSFQKQFPSHPLNDLQQQLPSLSTSSSSSSSSAVRFHQSPPVDPNPNLYIHNVPKDATEGELRDLFSTFGKVERIRLKVNQKIGPQALYAFVTFQTTTEAQAALDRLNGFDMRSRKLRIEFQRSRSDEDRQLDDRPYYDSSDRYHHSYQSTERSVPRGTDNRRKRGIPSGGGGVMAEQYGEGYGDQESGGSGSGGNSFKRARYFEVGREYGGSRMNKSGGQYQGGQSTFGQSQGGQGGQSQVGQSQGGQSQGGQSQGGQSQGGQSQGGQSQGGQSQGGQSQGGQSQGGSYHGGQYQGATSVVAGSHPLTSAQSFNQHRSATPPLSSSGSYSHPGASGPFPITGAPPISPYEEQPAADVPSYRLPASWFPQQQLQPKHTIYLCDLLRQIKPHLFTTNQRPLPSLYPRPSVHSSPSGPMVDASQQQQHSAPMVILHQVPQKEHPHKHQDHQQTHQAMPLGTPSTAHHPQHPHHPSSFPPSTNQQSAHPTTASGPPAPASLHLMEPIPNQLQPQPQQQSQSQQQQLQPQQQQLQSQPPQQQQSQPPQQQQSHPPQQQQSQPPQQQQSQPPQQQQSQLPQQQQSQPPHQLLANPQSNYSQLSSQQSDDVATIHTRVGVSSSSPSWLGVLTRNNKRKVPIELIRIDGLVESFLTPNINFLNISHRSSFEDVAKKQVTATCFIRLAPSSDISDGGQQVQMTPQRKQSNRKGFSDHVEYLTSKGKSGVITLTDKKQLYLIPAGVPLFDGLRRGLTPPDSQVLIGLFTNAALPQSPHAQPRPEATEVTGVGVGSHLLLGEPQYHNQHPPQQQVSHTTSAHLQQEGSIGYQGEDRHHQQHPGPPGHAMSQQAQQHLHPQQQLPGHPSSLMQLLSNTQFLSTLKSAVQQQQPKPSLE